jgi:hypothetical protein
MKACYFFSHWQYAINVRCCVVVYYHTYFVVPSLRMSGAIPPLPNMPLWCAQGQIYLSHYNEMAANVVTLQNVCPLLLPCHYYECSRKFNFFGLRLKCLCKLLYHNGLKAVMWAKNLLNICMWYIICVSLYGDMFYMNKSFEMLSGLMIRLLRKGRGLTRHSVNLQFIANVLTVELMPI